MWMTTNQLLCGFINNLLHGKSPCFLCHAGMEDDLQKQVPQLLTQKVRVLKFNGLQHLIGFLY